MRHFLTIFRKHRPGFPVLCFFIFVLAIAAPGDAKAQCSICTRTAQQLGERPAKALNKGILYLAFAPLAIVGFVGFRWYKSNGVTEENRND